MRRLSLMAEFWVEGLGDNYGADTTEAETYLYLATDQVCFYNIDARENYAHAGGGYAAESRGQGAPPGPLSRRGPATRPLRGDAGRGHVRRRGQRRRRPELG
jgi:hypothetical protein